MHTYTVVCGGVHATPPWNRDCNVAPDSCSPPLPDAPIEVLYTGGMLLWPAGQALTALGVPVAPYDDQSTAVDGGGGAKWGAPGGFEVAWRPDLEGDLTDGVTMSLLVAAAAQQGFALDGAPTRVSPAMVTVDDDDLGEVFVFAPVAVPASTTITFEVRETATGDLVGLEELVPVTPVPIADHGQFALQVDNQHSWSTFSRASHYLVAVPGSVPILAAVAADWPSLWIQTWVPQN